MKTILSLILFISVSFAQNISTQTVTVAQDTTRSAAYTAGYLNGVQRTPVAFQTPAALTTDSLYIEVSSDGTNYYRLENADGTPVLYIVEASRTYYLDNDLFKGVRQFKFANASDVEAAARTYTIIEME